MSSETTAGRLTVHALDTAQGRPASGLPLRLYRLQSEGRTHLGTWVTNSDGRCDAPLLQGNALTPGIYEVEFDIAAWCSDPGFYDLIPIRFRITDPDAHYHIPLLVSPYGYTTYRGS